MPVTAPYRLDLTARILRRLSTAIIDQFEDATYRRLIGSESAPLLLTVTQTASERLRVTLSGKSHEKDDASALVRTMLGTEVDLSSFSEAVAKIPWLTPLVTKASGLKPPCYPTIWEACVNSIVYQQISIFAAGAILRRVIERLTEPVIVNGVALRFFPGPQRFIEAKIEDLRAAGLSESKVRSIRAMGTATLEGRIDDTALRRLPTCELMESLTTHKGIGAWTAAVIALRGFGRLDLFPMKDSGATRLLKDIAGDATPNIELLPEQLGPQRGMLYYYLLLHGMMKRGELTYASA